MHYALSASLDCANGCAPGNSRQQNPTFEQKTQQNRVMSIARYIRHSGSRYATQTPPEQVHLSNMRLNGVHRSVVMLRISNVSPWLVAVWSGSLVCAPDHTHTGVGPTRQRMSVFFCAPLMPLYITTTLAQYACHVMSTVRFTRATQTVYIHGTPDRE